MKPQTQRKICSDCDLNPAEPRLTTPNIALCKWCWNGKETPEQALERIHGRKA